LGLATDLSHTIEELATRLYAAVVSDALDVAGACDRILAARIRPLVTLRRPLVGRAATARAERVECAPERPYGALLGAMDMLERGQVLVIAGEEGDIGSAIFGGLLATAALARGAAGCIVDGAVRDSRELERLGFPTFATGCSPADSYGRDEVVEHGRAIHCGGVEIHPGDLVVGDRDGVVAIPAPIEQQVIDYALRKVAGEGDMRKELAAGMSTAEAFAKYGIL
jgi:4-hydroxy-4-methyl-2-oxoglutarate aldolase